jgi:1-acyl-sn-glycerol-3-phosphate acyltransferase
MTPSADDRHSQAVSALDGPPPLRGAALLVSACRSAATYAALTLYVLLTGPPGLLVARLFDRPGLLYVLAHGGVALGLRVSGIRYEVTGRERLPRGRAAVYCANHTSNIDAPLLFHLLHPRLHMLYKAEFGRMPILGRAAPMAGFIPVERQNPEQSQHAVDQAALSVAAGRSFMVFPEGTRSRSGELLPFKKGGFIMAIKAQAPVVPVAIAGGRAAMVKGSRLVRPVTVRVAIGDPIETTGLTLEDRDRLIAMARGEIERMLAAGSRQPLAGHGHRSR